MQCLAHITCTPTCTLRVETRETVSNTCHRNHIYYTSYGVYARHSFINTSMLSHATSHVRSHSCQKLAP